MGSILVLRVHYITWVMRTLACMIYFGIALTPALFSLGVSLQYFLMWPTKPHFHHSNVVLTWTDFCHCVTSTYPYFSYDFYRGFSPCSPFARLSLTRPHQNISFALLWQEYNLVHRRTSTSPILPNC